ncbi:hypothetical protein LIER_01199 [Lithospermum erythrorhizon]|uniref:Uncharacterized protein n=1 Tax=Lithospermum erythrorhizon TaxID=34254 RepID=A0AAV3NL95_LITER
MLLRVMDNTSQVLAARLLGILKVITVTEKTMSKREEPTASLLLKNCMLKGDMEGIMGYSSPSELHDAFSHFRLKSTECAHGLFLKWKESEES